MTIKIEYRCSSCGQTICGNSRYCVRCFEQRHKPCPHCMHLSMGDVWSPRRKGKPPRPIDCAYCNNERWIIIDERE